MALSNWDCIAWNEEGKPCDGLLHTPDGIIVEIYKNWIYVKDVSAYDSWKSDSKSYRRPTIMEIQEGVLQYKNLHIVATRGKQNGVYVVVVYWDSKESIKKGLYGIGCYGFIGDEWVGVLPETVYDFFKWLEGVKNEYFIPHIPDKFEDGKRFNQGDKYFADCLGFDIPFTKPGEADDPIFLQALRKLELEKE